MADETAPIEGEGAGAPDKAEKSKPQPARTVPVVVLAPHDALATPGTIVDRQVSALKKAGAVEGVHWRRAKPRDLAIAGRT